MNEKAVWAIKADRFCLRVKKGTQENPKFIPQGNETDMESFLSTMMSKCVNAIMTKVRIG